MHDGWERLTEFDQCSEMYFTLDKFTNEQLHHKTPMCSYTCCHTAPLNSSIDQNSFSFCFVSLNGKEQKSFHLLCLTCPLALNFPLFICVPHWHLLFNPSILPFLQFKAAISSIPTLVFILICTTFGESSRLASMAHFKVRLTLNRTHILLLMLGIKYDFLLRISFTVLFASHFSFTMNHKAK